MSKPSSSISIKLNGVEISDRVVYRESSFNAQANPMQGSFTVVVRDPDQDFAPVSGQKLTLHIDGVALFGGYVLRIGRGSFLEADDTSVPIRSRKWTLSGPDFNFIFDKRIIYDPANLTAKLSVPVAKRTVTKALKYLLNNYVDVPSEMNHTTYVDTIMDEDEGGEAAYGGDKGSSLLAQSSTWRAQMDDFIKHCGGIYYIDGDYNLHFHGYESILAPWTITDANVGGNTVKFRAGTYEEDFTRIITEAHVWGGSSYAKSDGGTGGDVVYKKYPDYPISGAREQGAMDRLNTYGRWQMAEEHVGSDNYLTQKSVRVRAKVIATGPTGAVPTYGLPGGFSRPLQRMNCTWYAHDVPGGAHIRPGYLMDFILYSQAPLAPFRLPLRNMRISFPLLPTDNPGGRTFVQFDGEFGVVESDSRYLWRWLRMTGPGTSRSGYVSIADDSTLSVTPGTLATVHPTEGTNGTRKVFTFPYTFYQDQFSLYINGLFQRANLDYQYDADAGTVTFATAPDASDQIWAVGYVSQ